MPAEPLKVRFSKRLIEALSTPTADRAYYYDSEQPGLALAVTANGAKSFYYCYRIHGQFKRFRIGSADVVTTEQARSRAKELAADVTRGTDPQTSKQASREGWTLEAAFEHYLDRDAWSYQRRRTKALAKNTADEYRRQWKLFLAKWANRSLDTIQTEDVVGLRNRVRQQSGPYQSNRLLAILQAIFNHAERERRFKGVNPVRGVGRAAETQRERYITDQEMPAFLKALDDPVTDSTFRDFVWLALLTGQRKTNIQQMRWEQVNLDKGIWYIPQTKAGTPHVVSLSGRAVEILMARRQGDGASSPWVFPGPSKSGSLPNPQRDWVDLCERGGLPGLRIHDCRHTAATWLAMDNSSLQIISQVLGHKAIETTRRYSHFALTPVREASERLAAGLVKASKVTKGRAK